MCVCVFFFDVCFATHLQERIAYALAFVGGVMMAVSVCERECERERALCECVCECA